MEEQPDGTAGYQGIETGTAGDLQEVCQDYGEPPVSGKASGVTGL